MIDVHRKPIRIACCRLLLAAGLLFAWGGSAGAEQVAGSSDLTELSIEELMNVEVTSVSKKPQKLFGSAAAIYVISQEDLQRAGVTTLPDALRMVPGVQVAQVDANKWAISIRGFNGIFTNKLLVLVDGRSVYTPVFSGVFWELQDTMLEDVERIEVIRGPGGTLWGANAVNGVINIITKPARETQGGLLTAGTGAKERSFSGVRYGGKIGDDAFFRVFARYFNRDQLVDATGAATADSWDLLRGGFRIDWGLGSSDALTVQGEAYGGSAGQTVLELIQASPFSQRTNNRVRFSGQHLQARWQRILSERSDLAVHFYYDRSQRSEARLSPNQDIVDLEFQHRFVPEDQQELTWGLSYRLASDDIADSLLFTFSPRARTTHLFTAFIQDEIRLVPDRFNLILGSKFEWNDYTGFEVQPNARFVWTPNPSHVVWGAVSRAVRTPSRLEDSAQIALFVPPNPSGIRLLTGFSNPNLRAEKLLAYELGYRVWPADPLFLELATFYHEYHDLSSAELGSTFLDNRFTPPLLAIPVALDNRRSGEAFGVELSGTWNVTDAWRLNAGGSWLRLQLRSAPGSTDRSNTRIEGQSPLHQAHLRSYLDLPHNLKLDAALYVVDDLPGVSTPSYARLDARLNWRPVPKLDVTLGLQNLFGKHKEYGIESGGLFGFPSEVQRNVYGKVTWQF